MRLMTITEIENEMKLDKYSLATYVCLVYHQKGKLIFSHIIFEVKSYDL